MAKSNRSKANDMATRLGKIFCFERIRDVEWSLNDRRVASVKVMFVLDEVRANEVLSLLNEQKWGQNNG